MKTLILAAAILLAQDESLVKEYKKKLSKIDEKDASAHYKLGLWCLQNELPDLAEERFERVLELDPDHGDARDRLGYVRENGAWKESPRRTLRLRCVRAVRTGVHFPSAESVQKLAKKGPLYKKAVEVFCNPETWAQALAALQERTGLFEDKIDIQVVFVKRDELGPDAAALGTGADGAGQVKIDLDKTVDYLKRVEEVRREKSETDIQLLLPPIPLQAWATRELTRVYQNGCAVEWLADGMAAYAAGSPYWLAYLKVYKIEVVPIDRVTNEKKQHIGRGQAFFSWLEETSGRDKVKEFARLCIREKIKPEAAAEKVTGLTWADIAAKELAWSRAFVKSQKMDW